MLPDRRPDVRSSSSRKHGRLITRQTHLVTGLGIIVAELPREPLLQMVLPLCMLLALLQASGSMSRAPCLDEARRCSERQHRVLGECVHDDIWASLLMVLLLLPAGATTVLLPLGDLLAVLSRGGRRKVTAVREDNSGRSGTEVTTCCSRAVWVMRSLCGWLVGGAVD